MLFFYSKNLKDIFFSFYISGIVSIGRVPSLSPYLKDENDAQTAQKQLDLRELFSRTW